jgi:DNA-binding MarR family transcriptional regulator
LLNPIVQLYVYTFAPTSETPAVTDKNSRLLSVFLHLRAVENTLNANDLAVLYLVAETPGATLDDLWRRLDRDVAPSTISRVVSRLSNKSNEGSVLGHGFIQLEIDGADARLRRLYLTVRGQKLLKEIADLLG